MKAIFRSMGMAAVAAAFIAGGSVVAWAQTGCDSEEMTALRTKWDGLYAKTDLEGRKAAVAAAKEFVEKYGTCETQKDFIEYLTKDGTYKDANGRDQQRRAWIALQEEIIKDAPRQALFKRFDAGLKAKKWDDVYAVIDEFTAAYPGDEYVLDIVLPGGAIGLIESYNNNPKYTDKAIKYAKMALDKLNAGVTTKNFGAQQFAYGKKEEALAAMNLALARLHYWGKNDKKTGVAYYYAVTQIDATPRKDWHIYDAIGDFYWDDVKKLGDEIPKMIADAKAAESTDTPEVITQKQAAIDAKIALQKGYAERALDAYSRAQVASKNDTSAAAKEFAAKRYEAVIKPAYAKRFGNTEGVDAYIAAIASKPVPNPATAVTPIAEPVPATAVDGGAAAPAPATAPTKIVNTAAPAPTVKKPTSALPAPSPNGTAKTAKVVAKKPVVRKKGTR
jgi:hypothetical protein